MNRQLYWLVFILSLLIIYSCNYYSPVRFSKSVLISDYNSVKIEKDDNKGDDLTKYHRDKSYPVPKEKKDYRIYLKRRFAEVCSFSPIAEINSRGVEYALKGKFKEARIMFEEVIKEDAEFATDMGLTRQT